jgi:hypothetical protein
MINNNNKSVIELTDLIEKYKQDIFWQSQKLKKKFDKFYEKLDEEYILYLLMDYKSLGSFEINTFLYDRKLFFSEYRKSLFLIIDNIYKNKKSIDKSTLKNEIINNIYYSFFRIIKNITVLDDLFLKAPKTSEELVVFRGMKFITPKLEEKMQSQLRKLRKGDLMTFKNYLSTSLLNQVALDFLNSHFTDKKEAKCCLFKITIPKNTRVLYLDSDLTGFKFLKSKNEGIRQILFSEYEILLPRSCQLKFVKTYTISGKIPVSCKLENIKKGCITDVLVYEFILHSIDKNKEIFNIKKLSNPNYIKDIFKDLHHISLDVSKYDILQHSKQKNVHEMLQKFEKESRQRILKNIQNRI